MGLGPHCTYVIELCAGSSLLVAACCNALHGGFNPWTVIAWVGPLHQLHGHVLQGNEMHWPHDARASHPHDLLGPSPAHSTLSPAKLSTFALVGGLLIRPCRRPSSHTPSHCRAVKVLLVLLLPLTLNSWHV